MLKKAISIFISAIVICCMLNISGFANDYSDNIFNYSLTGDGVKVTSVKNTGISGSIQIPATFQGRNITAINSYAFNNCNHITALHISDKITDICENAFYGCTSLTTITVQNGNPNYCAVNNVLYNAAKTEIVLYPAAKSGATFTAPNTVKSIAPGAFSYTSNLKTVSIKNVNTLSSYIFNHSSLSSAELSENLTKIPYYAFSYCENLKEIKIPNSVKTIESYAFYGCCGLTSVTLPESLTSLNPTSFGNCAKLKTVTSQSKSYCAVNNVIYNQAKTNLICYPDGKTDTKFSVPTTVKEISANAFANAQNLKIVSVPGTVTKVGSYAFLNCSALTSAAFLNCETQIGTGAFNGCEKLTFKCYNNSTAHNFAKKNGISFAIMTRTTSLDLNIKSIKWASGRAGSLKTVIKPQNPHGTPVEWYSTNTKVVTVTGNGSFKTVGKGSANICCSTTDGTNKIVYCKVTVSQGVTSITLNATSLKWIKGKTGTFKATVNPSTAANKALSWSSSNTKVASVNSSGKLTAVNYGTAVITCKSKDGTNKQATCKVTVGKAVTSVKLNAASLNWTPGKLGQFTVTVSPSDAINKNLKWSTSNSKVAIVAQNGKIKAVSKGTAVITCAAVDGSGKKATCKVTVR